MIRFFDQNGNDLVANPPPQTSVTVATAGSTAVAAFSCVIVDTEACLFNRLNGTVSWDDGTPPVVYSGSGTLAIDPSRGLSPGLHIVNVTASDYALPEPVSAGVNFSFSIQVTSAPLSAPVLYGPILPKDVGYPNNDQWLFNTGSDLDVLASSVKMLLITRKGERTMLPDYGTNIRALIFEFDSSAIQSLIEQEISQALTTWEPRALLQSVTIEKIGPRDFSVNAFFVSKLNQQPFAITLPFS